MLGKPWEQAKKRGAFPTKHAFLFFSFLRHDGKMHGRGTYKYAEGDVYQGEWKDDKRHGKGVVTYAEGLVIQHRTIYI